MLIQLCFQPILSFADTEGGPLLGADWSLLNSLFVLAASRTDVLVWDVSKPSAPILRKTMHDDNVRSAAFSRTSEATIATTGQPGYAVKVTQHNS